MLFDYVARATPHLFTKFVPVMQGTGWRGKIAWTDIEIANNPSGQPEVTLSGEVKKLAERLGIKHISVSITHTANFAIASAVALSEKK